MAALVLASASPRRRQLLEPFVSLRVQPANIDETPIAGEHPVRYVERLARAKADAIAGDNGLVTLAADTTVDIDGAIVGKPTSPDDARRLLRCLSGREHVVHTGVAIVGADTSEHFVVSTSVRFVDIGDEAIDWYVATGEPLDVAGAYAIQGRGGAFVAAITGSFSNVVGLPLAETLAALRRAGVPTAAL